MITRQFVFDTETSDLPPDGRVCEVALLELNDDAEWIVKAESLIDPQAPVSPAASGVHNLIYEDLQDSPTIEEWFSVDDPSCYGKRIQADRVIFVAHRSTFDRHFLEPYIDGEILEVDTLRWARQLYPDAPNHQLATLKYFLGLPRSTGDAHRAMSDTFDCYNLLRHILQQLGCSIAELAQRSQAPMLIHTMPMGKHKGQPMSEVPRSYLDWALRNMQDLDQDQRFTFEHFYNKR